MEIKKTKTRRRRRNRYPCTYRGSGYGAQVGREPIARWWVAGAQGEAAPAHPAGLQHKGSAGSLALERVAMETLQQGCQPESQKPYPVTGAHQRVAGVTGRQQWQGGPQACQEPRAALLMHGFICLRKCPKAAE